MMISNSPTCRERVLKIARTVISLDFMITLLVNVYKEQLEREELFQSFERNEDQRANNQF